MQVKGLGKVVTDNDLFYLDIISIIVYYSDPEASLEINRIDDHINTSVYPSTKDFRQEIINNILTLHKLLNIKVDFSKSTKIQKNIYYKIDLG